MSPERFEELLGDVVEWRRDLAIIIEDARRDDVRDALEAADDDLATAEIVETSADLRANLAAAAERLDVPGGRRVRREILSALKDCAKVSGN